MTLEQLFEHAHAGRLQAVRVLSHEGAIYLLEALLEEGPQLLKAQSGDVRPRVFRSVLEVRRELQGLSCEQITLVHLNVADEMGAVAPAAGMDDQAMLLGLPL